MNHICWAYDPAAVQYSNVEQPATAGLWCTFTEKNESGWGRNSRHEGWDWISGILRQSGIMTTPGGQSLIDLWWICLASTLFKHELVHWWFIPDDNLPSDISLPDDHVTYKMLCGDLTSTHIPTPHALCCFLMYLLFSSILPRTHHFNFEAHSLLECMPVPTYAHKWLHVLTSLNIHVLQPIVLYPCPNGNGSLLLPVKSH